jgi:hypothetical protein
LMLPFNLIFKRFIYSINIMKKSKVFVIVNLFI